MEKKYLMGIDVGASGLRAACFDFQGHCVSQAAGSNRMVCPDPMHVYYDVDELRESLYDAIRRMIASAGLDSREIAGISFSFASGLMNYFTEDGSMPFGIIHVADARFIPYMGKVLQTLGGMGLTDDDVYKAIIGQPMNIAQMVSIQEEHPDIWEKITKIGCTPQPAVARMLGADGYYEMKSAGGYSGVYNPYTDKFFAEGLDAFGIDAGRFIPYFDTAAPCGTVSEEAAEKTGLAAGTPLFVGANDTHAQAAALGCGPDMAMMSLGTAAMLTVDIDEPIYDPGKKCRVVYDGFRNWKLVNYCSCFGQSFTWIRDNLCETEKARAAEEGADVFDLMTARAANSPIGANGVTFLPYFYGSDESVFTRAGFMGISTGNSKDDLIRAVMEGTVYEVKDALDLLEKNTGRRIEEVRVTGGGSKSPLWLQMMADVLGRKLVKADIPETITACFGAAIFAGIGLGIYRDLQDAARLVTVRETIEPDPENAQAYQKPLEMYHKFAAALNAVR